MLSQMMQGSGAMLTEYRRAKAELRTATARLQDTRLDLERSKEQVRWEGGRS